MKNKLRTVSAVILTACAATSILSSCTDKAENDATTVPTTVITTEAMTVIQDDGVTLEIASQNENYTIYKPVTGATKKTEAYIYASAPSEKTDEGYTYNIVGTKKSEESEKQTQAGKNNSSDEKIEEKSKGISLVTKSTPVMVGSSATIMIQGTPNKKYSIEFYESSSKKASYSGLESKNADENGLVTWTFEIDESCESGNRKIYIKENSSGNYLQTSITVQ